MLLRLEGPVQGMQRVVGDCSVVHSWGKGQQGQATESSPHWDGVGFLPWKPPWCAGSAYPPHPCVVLVCHSGKGFLAELLLPPVGGVWVQRGDTEAAVQERGDPPGCRQLFCLQHQHSGQQDHGGHAHDRQAVRNGQVGLRRRGASPPLCMSVCREAQGAPCSPHGERWL